MDQHRIEAMIIKMALVINDNYDQGPPNHDRVLEALSALAFTTAQVLAGTDHNEALVDFFYRKLADEARKTQSR